MYHTLYPKPTHPKRQGSLLILLHLRDLVPVHLGDVSCISVLLSSLETDLAESRKWRLVYLVMGFGEQ
jgi:hypothetical protein